MTIAAQEILSGKAPQKILVVKPSSLGDVVHSLPFLNSLRSCFPKSEIHWVIAAGLEGLLEGHPMIDRLIVIQKDMWKKLSAAGRTMREIGALYAQLRREKYDLAIDLQGLLRSGLICAASAAPVRIGFSEAREGSRLFYTHRIKGGRDVHAVERYMKIAGALGCYDKRIIFPFAKSKVVGETAAVLEDGLPYAVIVAGARWDTKIWPAASFGKVASMLPMRSVVVGGKKEMPLAEEAAAVSGGKARSLAGATSLPELIEIIRGATMVISNDSGPMHIAAGFGIPVAAIFGPTSPVRTGPYGNGHIIIRSEEKCSPCFRRHCPDLRCMRGISPEFVYRRIMDILRPGEA